MPDCSTIAYRLYSANGFVMESPQRRNADYSDPAFLRLACSGVQPRVKLASTPRPV
jgi:hypothetical protein